MTRRPDAQEGAGPAATDAGGDPPAAAAVETGGAAVQGMGAELASLNAMLTEVIDEQVRRGWTQVFKPPRGTPPRVGMATDAQVEPFRELRTRLMQLAADAGLARFTTLVVPVTEGSGASFVARNLACAFTLQQHLALLVDCNLRDGTQHALLGDGESGEGLLDFLSGAAPVERIVRPTALAGLHVIPAGRRQSALAPREPLSSRTMKALVSRLHGAPCYVVLDGPPVEGSPDARILSDLADFVVLVVGYGRSTAAAIERSAAHFDRKKLAGVVLNEVAGPVKARSGSRR